MQLCSPHPIRVRSGKFTTHTVTDEKQRKTDLTKTKCFLGSNKSWIEYKSLSKISLSANIDGSCSNTSFKCQNCEIYPSEITGCWHVRFNAAYLDTVYSAHTIRNKNSNNNAFKRQYCELDLGEIIECWHVCFLMNL